MTPGEGVGERPACLAIDIGASKVAVALVTPGGEVGDVGRLEVAAHPGDLFSALCDLARAHLDRSRVDRVGVGCAGPMTAGGETVSPLNIPAWRDFPLRDGLSRALGLPVTVEGDARALALGEGRFGAARGVNDYLSMVVSTGVGGGLVLDGRLVGGRTGNAGHLGHLVVVEDGAPCRCGGRGCLEAEASGGAIERRTGRPAREADDEERGRAGDLVGRAVGALAATLDFVRCFVAGSVALGYGAAFFDRATASAREVARLDYARDVALEPSPLGAAGPLLGAAAVAWRGRA